MTSVAKRWERFQSSSDAYAAVATMLIALIALPILTSGLDSRLEQVSTAVLIGGTVTIAMAASRARPWAIHTSWIAALVVVVVALLPDLPLGVPAALVLAIGLILTPMVILRRIGAHEIITATTMWGAISAYLAVGMAFSLLYAVIHEVDPSGFTAVTVGGLGDFNYFSFVTMTTLGYGDIAPVADLPRALAIIHTLIGQIFLVVVVARVVTLLGRTRPGRRPTSATGDDANNSG